MATDPSPETAENTTEGYQDMATLLEEESLQYKSLRRGEILEGVVVGSDRDGMVVDVGTKSEGVVPPSEMHSLGTNADNWPKSGDHLLVYVVQPETQEGQVLLSVDRARGEQGWRTLQQRFEEGESFDVQVNGFNKGGLLVNVEGVHAFIPFSQAVSAQPPAESESQSAEKAASVPESAVGKTLLVKVIEVNRARNRVILSERSALQDWRTIQKDRLLEELQEGELRKGRISSIRSFGVFVDLGGADGLAHLSELSWERDKTPEDLYRIGQEVDVYVMKVDREAKKIALSLRRAQPEQWEGIVEKYQVGQVVTGTITKLVTFGAFARIEGPVEGLIHVSELVNRRIAHPREVLKEGNVIPLKIVRIERDRQRLGLSLRQAREEAEDMGFVFDQDGQVVGLPGGEKQSAAEDIEPVETAEIEAAKVEAEEVEIAETVETEVEAAAAVEEETAVAEETVEAEAVEAETEAVEAEATEPVAETEEIEPAEAELAEAIEAEAKVEEAAVEATTAEVEEAPVATAEETVAEAESEPEETAESGDAEASAENEGVKEEEAQ